MNPHDDLFDLANSLSTLVGAPVTIEDGEAAVVAYSGGQRDVDAARVESILGRRVPWHYRQALAAAGVFDAIARSDQAEFFDLSDAEMSNRAVIAACADGVLVGSIWIVTPTAPTDDQRRVMTQAAPIVGRAIASARRRSSADERRRRAIVETLMDGEEPAARLADQMGWSPPLVVAALQPVDPADDLGGTVDLHLSAMVPHAASAAVGDVVYAVLAADQKAVTGILSDLQRRLLAGGRPAAVGLGRPVVAASDLRRSRTDADLVVRAMRRRAVVDVVATPSSHFSDLMSDHARAFLDTYGSFGHLARMDVLDRPERTELTQTLAAFLRFGGDVATAAAHLHVHPNTVRNRIRRVRSSCDIDMDDPDTRATLWLELTHREAAD